METKLEKINQMIIAGFSVETTLENSNREIGGLYDDFMNKGKKKWLNNISKNKINYYYELWSLVGKIQYV